MSLIPPRSYGCANLTATAIGLATIPALLCLSDLAAIAQPLDGLSMSQVNVLFVNPAIGNDLTGNGSKRAPFKTITQALRIAQANNVIILSRGTYSTSSGETFPLMLKPGVSIQGDPHTRGRNILIQGGGAFLSPTFARQDVTILGANRARLTGVTVTNPNPRGYGLWLESSSPVVVENTFTGNNHDGISMTGNSAPTIRSNYFYQNGANGMTIYGTSRPQVQENVFEKTGFGINIAQQAAPMLVGNRITQNRSGIVAQANSRPVLRGNVISGNTEDGVVAIATSQPDLGTKTEAGGNVFRQNGRYDINSSASSQIIPAFGNQVAFRRTSGRVYLAETLSPVVKTPDANVATPPPDNRPLVRNPQPDRTDNAAGEFPIPSRLVGSSVTTRNAAAAADENAHTTTQMAPVEIPVPPPESTSFVPPTSNSPPPVQKARRSRQTLPVLQPARIVESALLPVPSPNVPTGNARQLPKVTRPQSRAPEAESSPLLPRATSGLRYRVVVQARSESEQARVRSLVPGAFSTVSNGRAIMQAGAFSDRANANEVLQILKSKGFRAAIEQLN